MLIASRLYAMKKGLRILQKERTKMTNALLTSLINQLEKGKKVDFVLAMKLEIVRLHLNLSAAERDRALVSIGIVPATIDPNNLIDEAYMIRLCKYTDSLALLGQAAFEDKINGSIGLERVDEDVVDLWNIGEVGETCSSNECEVRADVKSLPKASSSAYSSRSSQLFLVCSQCGRKTCKVCCAGKGAALLSNVNYKEMKIYTGLFSYSDSDTCLLDGVICKSCCSEVILHAVYVDYIRVLSSLRRRARADRVAEEALEQVVGHGVNSISNNWQGTNTCKRQWENLLNGEESLAEFPYASLLHTVETAASSEPSLSLLAPPGTGDQHSYWSAPPNVSTVEFSIVLGTLSDVSGVALIVSSCGYSTSDCPMVAEDQPSTSESLNNVELLLPFMGDASTEARRMLRALLFSVGLYVLLHTWVQKNLFHKLYLT